MKVHNFADHPSLVSQYLAEMRDINIQGDRLRFRRNLERLGEIFAYEISKTLSFKNKSVITPLGVEATCQVIDEPIVLATIFRAGVPFTQVFYAISTMPKMPLYQLIANIKRKKTSISA